MGGLRVPRGFCETNQAETLLALCCPGVVQPVKPLFCSSALSHLPMNEASNSIPAPFSLNWRVAFTYSRRRALDYAVKLRICLSFVKIHSAEKTQAISSPSLAIFSLVLPSAKPTTSPWRHSLAACNSHLTTIRERRHRNFRPITQLCVDTVNPHRTDLHTHLSIV